MKKILFCALSLLVVLSSSPSFAWEEREEITDLQEDSDRLYRHDIGGGDGAFTALGSSMFAWGAILAVVVTVVTLGLQQSSAKN